MNKTKKPTKGKTTKVCDFCTREWNGVTRTTEVHKQEYGNFNYILVETITAIDESKRQHGPKRSTRHKVGQVLRYEGGPLFTVFTKDEHCGRGEYAEELDIQLEAHAHRRGRSSRVKKIAEAVLKAEYEDGLRVSKIVERFGMFF